LKTFAIDTSSLACSCALVQDGALVCESYLHTGLTHSRTLTAMIRETLARAETDPNDLDRLAVCVGPGSYTGLRIGVSAVKGMAAANGTPCVGVSTLEALAYNVACRDGIVCAALDARVGQVYAALFSVENGAVTRLTDDDALSFAALGAILPEGALVVGDGAALVCGRFPEKRLICAPPALRYQRAASAALLAETREAGPAAALKPDYHRKSQAEREREARLQEEENKE